MKIKIPKPDLKGGLAKLKNLKKEDVITWWKERKERRARILEARRNSAFAKKMQPVYAFMNRFSLLFHALLACILNFVIEAISRHSVIEAGAYMIGTPLVFLYNAFMIFITFSIVYFFKRRIFVRIIISVFWLVLGVANGYMLLKRVTPFNAQDLKVASDGLALINNYFNGFECGYRLRGGMGDFHVETGRPVYRENAPDPRSDRCDHLCGSLWRDF